MESNWKKNLQSQSNELLMKKYNKNFNFLKTRTIDLILSNENHHLKTYLENETNFLFQKEFLHGFYKLAESKFQIFSCIHNQSRIFPNLISNHFTQNRKKQLLSKNTKLLENCKLFIEKDKLLRNIPNNYNDENKNLLNEKTKKIFLENCNRVGLMPNQLTEVDLFKDDSYYNQEDLNNYFYRNLIGSNNNYYLDNNHSYFNKEKKICCHLDQRTFNSYFQNNDKSNEGNNKNECRNALKIEIKQKELKKSVNNNDKKKFLNNDEFMNNKDLKNKSKCLDNFESNRRTMISVKEKNSLSNKILERIKAKSRNTKNSPILSTNKKKLTKEYYVQYSNKTPNKIENKKALQSNLKKEKLNLTKKKKNELINEKIENKNMTKNCEKTQHTGINKMSFKNKKLKMKDFLDRKEKIKNSIPQMIHSKKDKNFLKSLKSESIYLSQIKLKEESFESIFQKQNLMKENVEIIFDSYISKNGEIFDCFSPKFSSEDNEFNQIASSQEKKKNHIKRSKDKLNFCSELEKLIFNNERSKLYICQNSPKSFEKSLRNFEILNQSEFLSYQENSLSLQTEISFFEYLEETNLRIFSNSEKMSEKQIRTIIRQIDGDMASSSVISNNEEKSFLILNNQKPTTEKNLRGFQLEDRAYDIKSNIRYKSVKLEKEFFKINSKNSIVKAENKCRYSIELNDNKKFFETNSNYLFSEKLLIDLNITKENKEKVESPYMFNLLKMKKNFVFDNPGVMRNDFYQKFSIYNKLSSGGDLLKNKGDQKINRYENQNKKSHQNLIIKKYKEIQNKPEKQIKTRISENIKKSCSPKRKQHEKNTMQFFGMFGTKNLLQKKTVTKELDKIQISNSNRILNYHSNKKIGFNTADYKFDNKSPINKKNEKKTNYFLERKKRNLSLKIKYFKNKVSKNSKLSNSIKKENFQFSLNNLKHLSPAKNFLNLKTPVRKHDYVLLDEYEYYNSNTKIQKNEYFLLQK